MSCPPAKKAQLRSKFAELDQDGSGTLDFNELHDLLTRGNPNITEDEVMQLFSKCDADGNGFVDFDEFVDYIYKDSTTKQGAGAGAGRSTAGRHAAAAQAAAASNDGTETDWEALRPVFEAYNHSADKHAKQTDMINKNFAKVCKECGLFNASFKKTDVDIIWAKVVEKGKRHIGFPQFQDAIRLIAAKSHRTNGEVMAKIGGSSGPVINATKTEYSKFYDDKSTFTGSACYNDNLGSVGQDMDRHARQQEQAAAALGEGESEDPALWGPVRVCFDKFIQESGGDGLDGRTWLKLCGDCHLVGKKFTKQDVDIVFTKVCRKAKKMNFEQFEAAVRETATKRGEAIARVQKVIADCDGPQMHGTTKLEACKFYDDKDQYTGAAADVFGREGHGDGEAASALRASAETIMAGSEGEHDWGECLITFAAFADSKGGGSAAMESREFLKMCVDLKLFDSKFTKNDLDIVFTKAKGSKAVRSLDDDSFKKAVRLIADKKGVRTDQVQSIIAKSDGPHMHATKTEYSKFYDDKSTYTGAAVNNENLQ